MPMDPAGTKPGLTETLDETPQVMIRCKGDGCSSIHAIELKTPGQRTDARVYQCIKCKRTFSLTVGGAFDL